MQSGKINFKARTDGELDNISEIAVQFNGSLKRPSVTAQGPQVARKKQPLVSVEMADNVGGLHVPGTFYALLDVALKVDGKEKVDGFFDSVMMAQDPKGNRIIDIIIDPVPEEYKGISHYKALSKKLNNKSEIEADVIGDETPDIIFRGPSGVIHVFMGVKNETAHNQVSA